MTVCFINRTYYILLSPKYCAFIHCRINKVFVVTEREHTDTDTDTHTDSLCEKLLVPLFGTHISIRHRDRDRPTESERDRREKLSVI